MFCPATGVRTTNIELVSIFNCNHGNRSMADTIEVHLPFQAAE